MTDPGLVNCCSNEDGKETYIDADDYGLVAPFPMLLGSILCPGEDGDTISLLELADDDHRRFFLTPGELCQDMMDVESPSPPPTRTYYFYRSPALERPRTVCVGVVPHGRLTVMFRLWGVLLATARVRKLRTP